MKLLVYFWYATPQFVSYVLPVAALVTTLVTVGLLTRTNELTVMKACGISLYRMGAPILCFSLLWSGLLFAIGETVLARANRRAEALNREIRTGRTQPFGTLDRTWLVDEKGDIYHYLHFDAAGPAIGGLSVYELTGRPWSLAGRTYAAQASFQDVWKGRDVWSRGFTAAGVASAYDHDTEHQVNCRVQVLADVIGLEGVSSHSGRRGLASELVRRGASTTAVQLAGGWRSASMVARYASAVAVEDGAVARLFGPS